MTVPSPSDTTRSDPPKEHFDVLIVGAGLSGIGAANHLTRRCPGKTYAVLEGRERLGGTWDLFRYPGIRSDSDMYTLGYSFKPWTNPKAIADAPSILEYVEEAAREGGVYEHIRYRHRVESASWNSESARWTVTAEIRNDDGTSSRARLTCRWLAMCTGYYRYGQAHAPSFPHQDEFEGQLVHPQFWPEDLDYRGRRVVVIGSGATAVTLVPAMAEEARHVTMLQRSPTYVVSRPQRDRVANFLRRILPERAAYAVNRWKNVLLGMWFYNLCKRKPEKVRQMILDGVREELGDDYDVERHFTPSYDPWDQRLCLVPDSDLFVALREGKASVVTDHIERFTRSGIELRSGERLEADIIVTATGLDLEVLGGLHLEVDGQVLRAGDLMTYKGMMFSGVPNLSLAMGYTNASWTLKADLISRYMCRLLLYMDRHGYDIARPGTPAEEMEPQPFLDLTSGYVKRTADRLPKQGTAKPWRLYQNYLLDSLSLRFGGLRDEVMQFERATGAGEEDRKRGLAEVA